LIVSSSYDSDSSLSPWSAVAVKIGEARRKAVNPNLPDLIFQEMVNEHAARWKKMLASRKNFGVPSEKRRPQMATGRKGRRAESQKVV
jgi:hypothetical protein